MEYTEIFELGQKVASGRLHRQRQYVAESIRSSKSGSRMDQHLQNMGTPFGPDLTIARLFSASPPTDTYTVANDVDEDNVAFAMANAHAHRERRRRQREQLQLPTGTDVKTDTNAYANDNTNVNQDSKKVESDRKAITRDVNAEINKNTNQATTHGTTSKSITAVNSENHESKLTFGYVSVNVNKEREQVVETKETGVGEKVGTGKDNEDNKGSGVISNPSLLSKVMRVKPSFGSKVITGPSLVLKIYLPNHVASEYEEVEIALNSTVEDTIQALIRQHVEKLCHSMSVGPDEFADNLKLMLNSNCYELRLHEEDGIPDEDFPALDRSRMIKNFCETSNNQGGPAGEYCLCTIPGAEKIPADQDLQNLFDYLVQAKRRIIGHEHERSKSSVSTALGSNEEIDHVNRLSRAIQKLKGGVAIKVLLPENMNTMHTTLQVTKGMKAYELLDKVQRKQNLPLYAEEFQFVISEEDRNRLSLISRVIDMNTDIYEDIHCLGVRTIELRRRKYADAPMLSNNSGSRISSRVNNYYTHQQKNIHEQAESPMDRVDSDDSDRDGDNPNANRSGRRSNNANSNPDNFLFNELTATVYQEWEVIKTNKWSKRQRRIMGIDAQKVYNKAPKGKDGTNKIQLIGGVGVKRSERLISDIIDIQFVKDKPSSFRIVWRNHSNNVNNLLNENNVSILEYESIGGRAAASEIISKIKYIKKH
eukprot:CAMPEP_0204870210 /NCGR_PEP_ID=MMETSP1348-20121228/31824_1 /ASSEMBLY_ACC=CAM_ASM_000700 /TAXON_ID=215587 /ORGANISM="Aplanochytrium stocchinoi, Strain GSBS06" /LENGTH=705 /DNA_ID=CAMNT_0052023905 /DNA_START=50 /DNA_END=2164 /DNA_ORIENTATION=-